MRIIVGRSGLAVLLGIVVVPALAGQGLFFDARRAGMGGVSLSIDASLSRYNVAYAAIPSRSISNAAPKATIPIPFGLIQFFHDHPISHLSKDPLFNPDSADFNPVALLNLILSPPLSVQVKSPPTPTNDVAIGVGKDSLQIDLGPAQQLIPADPFGFSGSSRPISIEPGFHGVHVGVMAWLYDRVDLQLGDALLGFLKNADTAQDNTAYTVHANAVVAGGFAPSIGYSGRVYGNQDRGLYLGAAAHYYIGVAYGSSVDTGGFITGSPIFGSNPATPLLGATTQYSKWGNSFGHGVGVDVGAAWMSGPIVFGLGVNDIGATITFPDTRIDYQKWDTTTDKVVSSKPSDFHVETKFKLPVTYLANVIYSLGGTTLGADVLDNGRGTQIHVGAEQRVGPFAVRGGVARDQRKKVELGWGGGVRLGPLGFDIGFWTRSNALSDSRAVSMATSLAIY